MTKKDLITQIIKLDPKTAEHEKAMMKKSKAELESLLETVKAEQPESDEIVNNKPIAHQLRTARARYTKAKTTSGKPTLHCGDDTAHQLAGMELNEIYRLAAEELDVPIQDLINKYTHLNVGMQRMCLGNRIRGHRGIKHTA